MPYKCNSCGKDNPGLYCLNCGIDKEAESHHDTTIITPTPFFREKDQAEVIPSETSYTINQRDLSVPIEKLKSHLQDTKFHSVTLRGANIHINTDEEKIWTGSPHPLSVMTLVIKWVAPILFASLIIVIFKGSWIWIMLFLLCAAIRIGVHLLALRSMRYRISSQRIEITDGLFHQQVRSYELHHMGDATVDLPLVFRLFGLSILKIEYRYGTGAELPLVRIFQRIPDNYTPERITLLGIPKEEARTIRDLVRNAGQIEASRRDKFRYR